MSDPETTPNGDSAPALSQDPHPSGDANMSQTVPNWDTQTELLSPDDPALSETAKAIISMRKRFRPLQECHHRAIELLIQGRTDSEVAKHLNITRKTITRWRLYNPLFKAALSRRRQEIYGSSAELLRISMTRAVKTLRKMLKSDNDFTALRAARAILSLAAYKGFAPPPEPIDPMGVMEQLARQKKIEWHKFDDPRFGALEEIDFLRAMEDLDEHQRNFPFAPDPENQPSPNSVAPQEEPGHPHPNRDARVCETQPSPATKDDQ